MKLRSKSLKSKRNVYNLLLDTDSYKISHHRQYPDGASAMYSYVESRGGEYDFTVFFGLQYIIQEYLETQITMDMIDEAEEMITEHGMGHSFHRAGWEYIVSEYDGYIPVKICAVPEGTVVPTKNVLFYVVCEDPKAFWIVSYIETMLLRVWAPITTATKSMAAKRLIRKAIDESSTTADVENAFARFYDSGIPDASLFKLHDFGARGGSSYETSSICGAAHLINFLGTDTLSALKLIKDHYGVSCAGFSIDASEHSTMTALGPEGEILQFRKMIREFGDQAMFACVSDGFNIYHAITNGWGGELYDEVVAMNAMLIVRPDSGNPIEMPIECIKLLDAKFGHSVNEKGYKVLNHVRVIQGDGIGISDIVPLCERLLEEGYSIDNLAFGMGGGLIQKQTRDTLKFAMKNSWMRINGDSVSVAKDPITDPGKKSKRGRMVLIESDGVFTTHQELTDDEFESPENFIDGKNVLETVFEYGQVQKAYTFEEIRRRAETYL